jgi:DNA-binding cell septation regulator SpoVG
VRDLLRVSSVVFVPAAREDRRAGLWGWVSFAVDRSVRLDAIGVRRTREGVWTLAFPDRRDRAGVAHPIVRPLDRHARAAIEAQVVAALRRQGHLS